MFSIDYSIKGNINYDTSGRPTVPLVLYQMHDDMVFQNRIDDMLFDTGAALTSLNKKVSYATLFDYVINDVIIATPSDDDVIIAEVIGMNILEKFHFAIEYESSSLYIEKCTKAFSQINPDFKCGTVSIYNR